MRTPVIAGNWKMNKTIGEALELVRALHYGLPWPGEVDVIVAPPFTAVAAVAGFLEKSYIAVAAQNLFWEESGAYTGEIAAGLIRDAGADHVIIGHSERRQYFAETDETVSRKVRAALAHDLRPIVCVGETLEQREAGRVEEVIEEQVRGGLSGLTDREAADLILAYEPVWAIGTGRTASPEQAQEVHAMIRGFVSRDFGAQAADSVRIQYGGSVNPKNSRQLLSQADIDGALVGGASLKAQDFIEIVRSARRS
jgi:triosephosphate isomerase